MHRSLYRQDEVDLGSLVLQSRRMKSDIRGGGWRGGGDRPEMNSRGVCGPPGVSVVF